MDAYVLAAELVAELGASAGRSLTCAELAARTGADEADVTNACTMLSSLGRAEQTPDGGYRLRTGADGRRRLVLVAENTSAVAHVLAALLDSEGYGVLIARSLDLALRVVSATRVDLVIADSFANTADAALKRLTELLHAAAPAPVLLFTGHRDVAEPAVRAAGFAGLLPKPFDIDDLLVRVAEAISGHAV